MIFIDGTNLFERLRANRLRLVADGLTRLATDVSLGHEVIRTYLYSSAPHIKRVVAEYQSGFLNGVWVVEGLAIPTGDGNFREKAVDAMLVADLVYHAATRNIDRAVLISADQDFVHAIRRVEDFGCRTAVIGMCCDIPGPLRNATDDSVSYDAADLVRRGVAEPMPL